MTDLHKELEGAMQLMDAGRTPEAEHALKGMLRSDPAFVPGVEALARLYEQTGHRRRCAQCFEHLGQIAAAGNDMAGAEQWFQKAAAVCPDYVSARHNLGVVMQATGRFDRAASIFTDIVTDEPGAADTWMSLGQVEEARGGMRAAHDAYARARSLVPRSPEPQVALGAVYHATGRFDDARAAYSAALKLAPGHPAALTGLAVSMDLAGEHVDALARVEPYMTSKETSPELELAYARLLRRAGRAAEALGRLEACFSGHGLSHEQQRHLHFSIGNLYDDVGEHARAFEHIERANRLAGSSFDTAEFRRSVDAQIDFFEEGSMRSLPRSENETSLPVFIVGMPRSGTTLVEQILAAHPGVHAAGERNDILNLVADLKGSDAGYPDTLSQIDTDALTSMAARYLSARAADHSGVQKITDKMPPNFRHLGLIAMLFPGARIIHCARHPMAVGLSCYFHDFSGPEFAFSNDLGEIGFYYREYRRAMDHWRRVLDVPIHEVRYERLVAQPERVSREIVEFAGLPWDAACLEFQAVKRTVNTASHAQVRRPIYTSAVKRHEAYGKWLEPLARALGGAS